MLLFIVPGIVKGISYSMALYIYAKNPEKGVRQCIAESVELMNGKKMKFFLLRLRYIGWTLLIWILSIPLIIATVLASLNAMIIAILIFIFSLPVMLVLTIVVLVHEEMVYTIFYFDITNDLKTDVEMSNINFSKDNVEKYEYTDIL